MSQILNLNERNQALLKFLFFFLVTIALIILAVFFDFRFPTRENKLFRDEIAVQRQIDLNQEKFVATLQDVSTLLDSLDKQGVNAVQVNLQLSQKLQDLNGLQLKDNSVYGRMDRIIVYKLFSLQEAKLKVQNMAEKENRISKLESELADVKNQLQQKEDDLDAYRRSR